MTAVRLMHSNAEGFPWSSLDADDATIQHGNHQHKRDLILGEIPAMNSLYYAARKELPTFENLGQLSFESFSAFSGIVAVGHVRLALLSD